MVIQLPLFGKGSQDHALSFIIFIRGGHYVNGFVTSGTTDTSCTIHGEADAKRFHIIDIGSRQAPVIVVAKDKRGGPTTEDRTTFYLIDEFDRLYQGRLRGLPSWPKWVEGGSLNIASRARGIRRPGESPPVHSRGRPVKARVRRVGV